MTRRKLVIFIIIDTIVIVAALAWYLNRQSTPPSSVPPATPTAVGSTAPAPADPPPADPAPATLPTAPSGVVERHGTFRGQPFWFRLHGPDVELGGHRKLELVYTPTLPSEVDGSIIHDSPVLILDEHLRLVRWNNRDGATGVLRQAEPDSYLVMREKRTDDDKVVILKRVLVHPAGWPLEVAPILALLAEGEQWSMPIIDCWGPRALEAMQATRSGGQITIAGQTGSITVTGITGEGIAVEFAKP